MLASDAAKTLGGAQRMSDKTPESHGSNEEAR